MKKKDLLIEVKKIAEEKINKNYQKEYKALIVENYVKFLDNEKEIADKERLLKILENVKWYSNANIDEFFSKTITEILNNTIGDLFCISKNKRTSSCYSIITNLLMQGKLEENNLIIYDKITKTLEYKNIVENSTILIMDDYSGSGESIINMVKAIENEYSNNKVLILCYVWQKKAIKIIKRMKKFFDKKLNNDYEIIEEGIILEDSYKEKFDKDNDTMNYIKDICECCKQTNIKYGYRRTGAMLTFNGISPNNNISMLWNNNIEHNNSRWFPIFNREYSLELLIRKKNEYLIKNKTEIFELYQESFLKKDITYEEFTVLIILFNTYSIRKEYIKEALGFDTLEEITKIIEKFVNCGIITYSIENILQFIDKKVINEMRRIDERISRSVGIIKGTRKQIDKTKPLE